MCFVTDSVKQRTVDTLLAGTSSFISALKRSLNSWLTISYSYEQEIVVPGIEHTR